MKNRRNLKRFASGFIAVLLMVSLNINPVVTIAQCIYDTGILEKLGIATDNLVYVIGNSFDNVEAAETSCDCTFECDATEAISTLMGGGGVTLTEMKYKLDEDLIAIKGSIETGDNQIVAQLGDVNETLRTISSQLSQINKTIENMQHAYHVAHLYSLNNESEKSLWRPYTSDVPYVEDFAMVSGPFASVYTGYWDTAVTTINNPMGATAERALNILGYDAIVRYEGVVLQKTVSSSTVDGMSGESIVYSPLPEGDPGQSAWTIASVEREEIGTNAVTWLDAVTLLYKAIGQDQYTYQSFKSKNYSITPETSPAFQDLSNVIPVTEADGSKHYNGWDFKMFITRSNVISGTSENATKKSVYWDKAISDGFIPASANMDGNILAPDFLKLAHKMMVAYGEPEMTHDETMALLQVYGTNFPISLGIEIADAWAYLKVRGCLSDDVIQHIGTTVSREDLLDICMRIKDPNSRLDYKNIDVVLDIGELLRDDGYYPVYDLDFSVGTFSTVIEYDYTKMDSYGYCVVMTKDMELGSTGKMLICSEKDIEKEISGALDMNSNMEIEGNRSILFTIPKTYSGNVYVTMVDLSKDAIVSGAVDWIEIPSSLLGGGLFFGSFSTEDNGKVAVASDDDYHSLDYLAGDKRLLPYADFERAEVSRPIAKVAPSNATVFERLEAKWNKWTTPMVALAAPNSSNATTVDYTVEHEQWKYINEIKHDDSVTTLQYWPETVNVPVLESSGSSTIKTNSGVNTTVSKITTIANEDHTTLPDDKCGINIANTKKDLYLARLYLVAKYPLVLNALKEPGTRYTEYQGNRAYNIEGDITDMIRIISNGFDDSSNSMHEFSADGKSVLNGMRDKDVDLYQAIKSGSDADDRYDNIYLPRYNDFIIRYLLGSAPAASIVEYADDISKCSIDSGLTLWTTRKVTVESDTTGYATVRNRMAIQSFISNQAKDGTPTRAIDIEVNNAVQSMGLSDASYDRDKNEFSFTFADEASASSFMDTLGHFVDSTDELEIQNSVSTSAIMSREEEKLISWSSLVEAGVVVRNSTGGQPKQQNDGSYMFYTKDGMVKVNPRLYTIQIGTTVYDLSSKDGTEGPQLVYVDDIHQGTGEMYIDVRCVMGLVAQNFVRSEGKTQQVRNSIGSQGYVVYDIGTQGLQSPLFEAYDINCYNYPEVPDNIFSAGSINENPVGSGTYPIKVYGETIYDNQYEIANGIKYWDENGFKDKYNRIGMSSFVPTANWITVINQDEDETVQASLFVFYPMAPFRYGYSNSSGGDDKVPDPGKDFNSDEAQAITGLIDELNACYPEDIRDEWYVKMTYEAAAHLYQMTGKWYLRGDLVIREFNISSNTYNFVEAWTDYPGLTETHTSDGANPISTTVYTEGGNADGAIYWLDMIGFVYNMPKVSDFDLTKYLTGQYPLPLATVDDGSGNGKIGIINYNMNYWGTWVDKDNKTRDRVPYGYTLSSLGYIHYKVDSGISYLQCDGTDVTFDVLPNAGSNDPNTGTELLPYRVQDSDLAVDGEYLHLAPSGVYFYFGGNTRENVPVNETTQTMTNQNYFYYGTSRVVLKSLDNDTLTSYYMISKNYNPIRLDTGTPFYRVYRNRGYDVCIYNGGVHMGSSNSIEDVIVDDYISEYIENPLDKLGATNLIEAIDEGSSLLILIAFSVLPMIGIVLMTALVGFSFVSNIKVVQLLCDKFIDPVKLLTFGVRDIHRWSYKTVLIPCIMLYCVFALFLNGNIIRLVGWVIRWYGVISRYFVNMF